MTMNAATKRCLAVWVPHACLCFSIGVLCLVGVPAIAAEGQPREDMPLDAPVEVLALESRELAPGAELVVKADAALIWTQYRGLDGSLVVEMPNTRTADVVEDLSLSSGLISSVSIVVPEPGASAGLLLGAAFLAVVGRRRARR